MTRLGWTGRVAGSAARRPWLFIVGWLAMLGLAAYLATGLGSVIDDGSELGMATESGHADQVIEEVFGPEPPPTEFLIVESTTETFETAEFQSLVAELSGGLGALDTVETVVSPMDGDATLLSEDGRVALISFTLLPETDEVDPIEPVVELVDQTPVSDYELALFGPASVGAEFDRLAEETLLRGEVIGLGIALLIMVGVFGALVAAGIPVLLSVGAIVVAVALTTIAGRVFTISSVVLNMITMIGLAVGIDYGLFILHRYREERAKDRPIEDAVALAGDSAGRAVLFSGITVIVALSGLLIVPDGTIRGVGVGAICAVIGAVSVALTLLPSILALLGDRVEKGAIRFSKRGSSRIWDRMTASVMRRPIVGVLAAGGLLIGLAIPFAGIQLGSNFIDSLPEDSSVTHGAAVMSDHFGVGSGTTSIVVETRGDDVSDSVDSAIEAALASGGYRAGSVAMSEDSSVAVIELADSFDPSTDEGRTALHDLRAQVIPGSFAGTDARVSVTGDAAGTADFVEVIEARFPIVVGWVLGVSFLLLLLAFRSIVVPLKAIVMNLLSVGAAYGLLVLVFQQGVGADLLGFQTSDVIEAWIPLFLFTVLFGLSMDYHIFLLSRIKEQHDGSGDNEASVAFGLRSTGGLITGAALIMVAVFGGFASGDLAMLQQLGFGLAAAVILDATVVRSVLVPSTMALLGERNWYLPNWLAWLPKVEIEGSTQTKPTAELVGTHAGGA
jgi:putative drug exporter of the RND superfamily